MLEDAPRAAETREMEPWRIGQRRRASGSARSDERLSVTRLAGWQLLIVGTSAGIRAMFVDGHLLIPALGTDAGLAASWVGWRLVRRIKEMGCRVETSGLRVRNISSDG